MTYEEILEHNRDMLIKYYKTWKSDIALLYGDVYAEKYCTFERFKDHIKVMQEMTEEKENE